MKKIWVTYALKFSVLLINSLNDLLLSTIPSPVWLFEFFIPANFLQYVTPGYPKPSRWSLCPSQKKNATLPESFGWNFLSSKFTSSLPSLLMAKFTKSLTLFSILTVPRQMLIITSNCQIQNAGFLNYTACS